MNLYQEVLIDHYRNPRNRGKLEEIHSGPLPGFLVASDLHNPSCGDSISWQVSIDDGKLIAIAFEGKGCVISQGAASMLSVAISESSLDQIMALDTPYMLTLIGLELGPTRLRCALLPLEALQQGIVTYQKSINSFNQG